ncbi:DUF3320 domain-containing protein [Mycobacterium celatum]|uniref:DNA helicase n=1 Tax=Mycobacterium celatum TaxID=28045 RepID=A0A1X1RMI3_MYCCE|nr:DUF3320 domain-containing protein [Mycobacterium celatum]ORV09814.1 DNA helicase [Mycobacterium celatum]PIB79623.1 DUF3320 domain-containing protein [Mycobacterium celatum]
MDNADHHSAVGDALGILVQGLTPFVEQVFADTLPPSIEWTELLRRKDLAVGRRVGMYRNRDLSLMLRAMTERLGELGYPFSQHLSRQGQNYASELRDVRNRWAHNEAFTQSEAYRAIDTVELLLRSVGAATAASQAAQLKASVAPSRGQHAAAEPVTREAPATEQSIDASAVSAPQVPPAQHQEPAPRIELQAVTDLSYAMAHCRVPVIDHVTVDNVGGEIHGAVVEVDVLSAEGSHGGPREVYLDLAAHKPTILRDIDLVLDPASMLRIDEQRPGSIRVVLRDAARNVLAQALKNVNILAANQWKAVPPQLALEMLAAHVQPNSAAIAALMTEVSDRLKALTGNPAIDGYQSENPDRVDAIAQAVFEAMRAKDIRYAEPPASWGLDGQKVRTPAEVLERRLGTCLDTTLTMAAALEQAGINSTVWVLKNHAFLGYWRIDSSLATVSSTDVVDAVNLVDLGHIRLVETTMVTASEEPHSFTEAVNAPRTKHLSDDLSAIVGVTGIRQAREAQIFPLPSRTVDGEGNVVVTRYEPAPKRVVAPYTPTQGTKPSGNFEAVPARVSQWKNALLDLSLRNKLINYTERSGYRLEVPGPAPGRFEDMVNASARIALLASDAINEIDLARGIRYGRDLPEQEREFLLAEKHSAYIDISSASYKSKLRYLAYKAKTIVEETGSNNLYLAFGMLSWRFNDRELRSPLVLVPVSMSTANLGEKYLLTIDEMGASTPNYCLVEKLRVAFGLEIPGLANPSDDGSGIDLSETFNAVRRAIAEAGLHFRVEESVHLSILQFAKFPLWKDLDESWKLLSHNSLVSHLIETPNDQYVDPVSEVTEVDLDDLGSMLPVPADSSQLRAVAEAVGGRTFVLEGPPGTGKSQTITNLLAHAMSSGRRVLFVAEKRAALEVVKKRLEAVGLGELSLNLHDKSARPAAVRAQIKEALDLRVSQDTDLLRTQTETAVSTRRSLARYADRLHELNAAGQSLYTARTSELAADQEVPPLDVPHDLVASGAPETFDAIGRALRELPEKADLARPGENHAWGFIDDSPNKLDVVKVHAAAVEFDKALEDLLQRGVGLDQLSRTETSAAMNQWAKLATAPRHALAALDKLHSDAWQSALKALRQSMAETSDAQPGWLAIASPAAMDLDIPAIHEATVAADHSSFFGRKKRRRAVLAQLMDVLVVDPKAIDLKSLSSTAAEIAQTHALVTNLRCCVAKLPVTLVGAGWNPLIDEHVQQLRRGLQSVSWTASALCAEPNDPHVCDLREYYARTPAGTLAEPLMRLAAAWQALEEMTEASVRRQRAWGNGKTFIAQWLATRPHRRLETAATLERWIDLIRHVEPLRSAGMESARTAILRGKIAAEDAALAFDRGTAIASVSERLEASALNDFDVVAHSKTIRRFTESTRAIRHELPRAIPARVVGNRRFDANTASGQIGGLRRQLERRRGGMSVRMLMENYGELITQILPCTLMSPDSVARFFPAQQGTFDIVVFDEASQIRVADAVGAMGRSKAVVVVGDSKQMPPTSFAEANASLEDEDEYNPDVVFDEESILTECVQAQVPRQWLSWHYRSQDESLIAFSNHQYYEGRLASFPAPLGTTTSAAGHGISLIRVNGVFDRTGRGRALRTNRVEAGKIVADIRQRFSASPGAPPSLGVITFNAQQRDLIENLLRDSGDERLLQALDEPDGLFVKNLENVQGDERDTILFSVAFSANDKGVVPLNFGPLSKPGGERRLNVAVTRARREVVLYSSFDPEALRAEETTQVGTKHLKAYLEMAAHGVQAFSEGGRRLPVIDRHRDDIAQALRAEGLPVRTDVGLSDFRVDLVIADPDNPEQPLVAVLLDGPNWYSRKTAADRDGLPVDVLENLMHWPAVERIWLPGWLRNKEQIVARVRKTVDEARQRVLRHDVQPDPSRRAPEPTPIKVAPTVVASTKIAVAPTRPQEIKRHPMIRDYHEWVPQVSGDVSTLDHLPDSWAKSEVRMAIHAAIDAEAPIHPDRLAKIVAGAFGLNRVSEERRRSIQRVVPSEYTRNDEEGFYWPPGLDPQAWRTIRCPRDGSSRALEEVCLIEIGNAMIVVAEQAGGIAAEELKREALNLFGGRRITQSVGSRLEAALKRALAKGLLRQSDNGLIFSEGSTN